MYVILLLYVTDERNVDMQLYKDFMMLPFFSLLYIGTVYITVYDIFQQKDSSAL